MVPDWFSKYILKHIEDYIPVGVTAKPVEIMKENNMAKHGIKLETSDSRTAPIVYLEDYFQDYKAGRSSLGEIMEMIAESYGKAFPPLQEKDQSVSFRYPDIRDKLIYELLEIRRNSEYLSDKVYQPVGNGMAKVYKIQLASQDRNRALVPLTTEIAQRYGYHMEELYKDADENMERLYPATFEPMLDVIEGLQEAGDGSQTVYLNDLSAPFGKKEQDEIYVLSNNWKLNGAAVLYYAGVTEKIAELIAGDYYILPSSRHEILIVRAENNDAHVLEAIVKEVNRKEVAKEDILSDHVLHYDSETKKLTQPLTYIPDTPQKNLSAVSQELRDIVLAAANETGGEYRIEKGTLPYASLQLLKQECGKEGLEKYIEVSGKECDVVAKAGLEDQFDLTKRVEPDTIHQEKGLKPAEDIQLHFRR